MPHACIEIAKFPPGLADETLRRANDELFPMIPTIEGFRGYVAGKTAPDSLVSIGVWDESAQAEAAAASLATWAGESTPAVATAVDRRLGALALANGGGGLAPAFVRLVFARLKPKVGEELLDSFGEKMVGFYRNKPGFMSCGIVKTSDDSGLLFTGWESKAQAEARLLASASALKEVALSVASVSKLMFSFKSFDVHVGEVMWSRGTLE